MERRSRSQSLRSHFQANLQQAAVQTATTAVQTNKGQNQFEIKERQPPKYSGFWDVVQSFVVKGTLKGKAATATVDVSVPNENNDLALKAFVRIFLKK